MCTAPASPTTTLPDTDSAIVAGSVGHRSVQTTARYDQRAERAKQVAADTLPFTSMVRKQAIEDRTSPIHALDGLADPRPTRATGALCADVVKKWQL